MKNKSYEEILNEFYQIEEDELDSLINVNNVSYLFDSLSEEEKEMLKEKTGTEYAHIKNHFDKNKGNT